jgi:hypothetical protein
VGVESDLFFKENGVIESASVLGYFICAAFIVCKRKIVHLRHIFLLIIFLMLRELDFHKRFTTMGIFKIRFFTSNNVPLMEKMIGILVILLLIYIAGSIFYRHSKNFTAGLKKRSTVSIGVLLAFAFMGLSKALDGLARKLDGVGIEVSKQISMHAGALEEILEFGIPIIILFTLSAYFKDAEG